MHYLIKYNCGYKVQTSKHKKQVILQSIGIINIKSKETIKSGCLHLQMLY